MPDAVLDNISHRRYNALRSSWILVSPHRTKRPWQGQEEEPSVNTLPAYDPSCYLCPSNSRAQGATNPDYKDPFIFVNDYSAVKESQEPYHPHDAQDADSPTSLLLRASPVTGLCHVMTFSPTHNLTLADLAPAAILRILQTWTAFYASCLSPTSPLAPLAPAAKALISSSTSTTQMPPPPQTQYRYMQIFENKGPAMGCSNPHPHCQVWTTSSLPEEPGLEAVQFSKHRREHGGRHLLVDYAALELQQQERIVFANAHFLAVVPWWATWPFEVLVLSVAHKRALVDLNAAEMESLAEVVAEVVRRYDNLFETMFPYSMGVHQAPLDAGEGEEGREEVEGWGMHVHFYPPLLRSRSVRKFLVGYEMLAEPQRDITPEQAARRLREECGGELYRKRLG